MFSKQKVKETILLAECKQMKFAEQLNIADGQCAGMTYYWLYLHLNMMRKTLTLDQLIKKEPDIIKTLGNNFLDILQLQQLRFFLQQKKVSASELKIDSLENKKTDVSFSPSATTSIKHNDSTDKIKQFPSAMKAALETIENGEGLNFSYAWSDESHTRKKNNLLAHSVGLIKNPTSDCELLFFDCNLGVYAFPKAETFYHHFAPLYFQKIFGDKGQPECFTYTTAKSIKPKLENTNTSHFINTTLSNLTNKKLTPVIAELNEIVIIPIQKM